MSFSRGLTNPPSIASFLEEFAETWRTMILVWLLSAELSQGMSETWMASMSWEPCIRLDVPWC